MCGCVRSRDFWWTKEITLLCVWRVTERGCILFTSHFYLLKYHNSKRLIMVGPPHRLFQQGEKWVLCCSSEVQRATSNNDSFLFFFVVFLLLPKAVFCYLAVVRPFYVCSYCFVYCFRRPYHCCLALFRKHRETTMALSRLLFTIAGVLLTLLLAPVLGEFFVLGLGLFVFLRERESPKWSRLDEPISCSWRRPTAIDSKCRQQAVSLPVRYRADLEVVPQELDESVKFVSFVVFVFTQVRHCPAILSTTGLNKDTNKIEAHLEIWHCLC